MLPAHTSTFNNQWHRGNHHYLAVTQCLPPTSSTSVQNTTCVSLDAFLSALATVLDHVAVSDIPSVVLGDFNEDLLQKPDSRVLSLMSSNGYEQLVQSPTTDRGTMIDHVYYNRLSATVALEVASHSNSTALLNFCRVCSVTQAFAACTPSLQWPPLQLSAADTPSLQHSSLPRMRRHSSGHQLRSAAYLHRATIPLLPRIAPLPPPNVLTWVNARALHL